MALMSNPVIECTLVFPWASGLSDCNRTTNALTIRSLKVTAAYLTFLNQGRQPAIVKPNVARGVNFMF